MTERYFDAMVVSTVDKGSTYHGQTPFETRMEDLWCSFYHATAKDPKFRKEQLRQLHAALVQWKTALFYTMQSAPDHYTLEDAQIEYGLSLKELAVHHRDVDLNEEPKVCHEQIFAPGPDHPKRWLPMGMLCIKMGPNPSLYDVIAPVAGAISRGNCVVLEVSTQTPF